MPTVELEKMSGGTMSRLRNGHACRCGLAKTKGSGVSCDLDESDIKELIKAGRRGAKKTIKLSSDAIQRNAVKGTGIMEGGRLKVGKTLKKIGKSKAVQGVKKMALKEVEDAAIAGLEAEGVPPSLSKKVVRDLGGKVDTATGGNLKKALKKAHAGRKLKNTLKRDDVQAVKKAGIKMLGDAAIAGLEAEGVPPPLAMAGVKALERKADKGTYGGAVRIHSRPYQSKDPRDQWQEPPETPPSQVPAHTVSGNPRRRRKGGSGLGMSGGSGLGMSGGSGLSYSGKGAGLYGGAIGPAVSAESLVRFGSGGNLLHGQNPALYSQPESANFSMHTQLPPMLARRMVD